MTKAEKVVAVAWFVWLWIAFGALLFVALMTAAGEGLRTFDDEEAKPSTSLAVRFCTSLCDSLENRGFFLRPNALLTDMGIVSLGAAASTWTVAFSVWWWRRSRLIGK
jgi:hypothetical protein